MERAELLALVCDVYWDFVTILGQVLYLIVSIPYTLNRLYWRHRVEEWDRHVIQERANNGKLMFHNQKDVVSYFDLCLLRQSRSPEIAGNRC